jgi:hypothetical protein
MLSMFSNKLIKIIKLCVKIMNTYLFIFLFIYSYINTAESSQGLALSAGSRVKLYY